MARRASLILRTNTPVLFVIDNRLTSYRPTRNAPRSASVLLGSPSKLKQKRPFPNSASCYEIDGISRHTLCHVQSCPLEFVLLRPERHTSWRQPLGTRPTLALCFKYVGSSRCQDRLPAGLGWKVAISRSPRPLARLTHEGRRESGHRRVII